jgi:hypothetical protein
MQKGSTMRIVYPIASIFLCSATMSQAATVSCGVGQFILNPTIMLGEISEGLNIEDYSDSGSLGITAIVTGNGKSSRFVKTFKYKKVGSRIEFDFDALGAAEAAIVITQVKTEQFQKEFGMVPDVQCSTP